MVVHQERRALVQRLRKIAKAYDAQRVPDSAGKDVVVAMVDGILSIPTLSSQDRATTLGIEEAYFATWESNSSAPQPSTHVGPAVQTTKEWKFHAAQLTYNCTEGDWASDDTVVLRGLFDRVVAIAEDLSVKLSMTGMGATMEG